MKKTMNLANRWKNIGSTISRFPIAVLMLFTAAASNALAIMNFDEEVFVKIAISTVLGSLVYLVFQLIYERFFIREAYRYIFMASSLVLAFLYYLLIRNNEFDTEMAVRTVVIGLILVVLLIWIPSVQSRVNFNQSFVAVFKSFFISLFLNCVLFAGVAIILGAINLLLFDIDEKAFLHAANIIYVFLYPFSFLLYLPVFPAARKEGGKQAANNNDKEAYGGNGSIDQDNEEKLNRAISCGKLLETLVSYIIIPVVAVFTLILVSYILINITGSFWTDNLLESMLVAYSITVIFVYLLASTIDNAWTKNFRRIFPKVLVVVVLFQTISSLMRISSYGVTYGRYYVIIFGIFSTVAGIIFSVMPREKNGLVAPILIILSLISILPGAGAFDISKSNQLGRLQSALVRNDMLNDDEIIAKSNISDEDKQIIISSFDYLNRMNYLKDISWLSEYSEHYNFEKIFGFSRYQDGEIRYKYVSLSRERTSGIVLEGYDYLAVVDANKGAYGPAAEFEKDGRSFSLYMSTENNKQLISLQEGEKQLVSFDMAEIFARFADEEESTSKSIEELTFEAESESAAIKVIIEYFSFNALNEAEEYGGQLYILVKVK